MKGRTTVFCQCGEPECDGEARVSEAEAGLLLEEPGLVLIVAGCRFGPPSTHPMTVVEEPGYTIQATTLATEAPLWREPPLGSPLFRQERAA